MVIQGNQSFLINLVWIFKFKNFRKSHLVKLTLSMKFKNKKINKKISLLNKFIDLGYKNVKKLNSKSKKKLFSSVIGVKLNFTKNC